MIVAKPATFCKFARSCVKIGRVCMSTNAQEQKVNINGQTINYVKVGHGKDALLCFPGALGSIWSDFKPQVEKLDRNKFTIVAFDPPGYGYSRPPNRKFTRDFYKKDAEFAHNLMQKLDLKQYSLLGWSDGGISSMILAANESDSIKNLIIWGSNAYFIKEEIDQCEKLKDISKWSDKMKAPLIALYTEPGLKEMWTGWCDAVIDIYKNNNGDICKNDLAKIKCPTLIMHGDKDPMVAAEHPGYLLKHIKGSTIVRFPDGKHNIHLKYSEDFNKIVTDFIGLNKQ